MKKQLVTTVAVMIGILFYSILFAQERKDKAQFKPRSNEFYEQIQKGVDAFEAPKKPDKPLAFRMDFTGMDVPKSMSEFKTVFAQKPESQGETGTCWCFSTTSFYESEIKRLSNQDIRTNAVNLVWEETAVRLLHPLLCVESKTQNLLRLPQDSPEAPRQDKKHLVLSIANLREHLLQRSTPPLAAQGLHIARRLVDFAYQEPGRNVLTRHQLDLLDGIPWPAWRANAVAELREFAGREPEFRKEIQERLEAEAEITRWIAELKARTK